MRFTLALSLSFLLAACATDHVERPYWEDPSWTYHLRDSFHFYYPAAAVDQNLPEGKATVRFIYQDGAAHDVQIVKSTGSAILDDSLTSQIDLTKLPAAYGIEKLQPHVFQFDFKFEATIQDFGVILKRIITTQTVDNLRKETRGDSGYVLAQFHYLDGKIVDAKTIYTQGDPSLADAVTDQLLHVQAPPPISALAGRKTRFVIGFCFIQNPYLCQHYENDAYRHVPKE